MQRHYKKLLLGVFFAFFHISLDAQEQLLNTDLGQARVIDIMNNGLGGVKQYNEKNIGYAEIANLDNDINLDEIMKNFACETYMGNDFLLNTLRKPINSQDKSNTIAYRRNVIKVLVENPEVKQEIYSLLEQAAREMSNVNKLIEKPTIKQTDHAKNTVDLVEINESTSSLLHGIYDGFTGTMAVLGTGLAVYCFREVFQGRDYRDYGYNYRYGYHRDSLFVDGMYASVYGAIFSTCFFGRYVEGVAKRQLVHSLYQLICISERIEALSCEYDFTMQFKASSLGKTIVGMGLIEQIKHERYIHESESPLVYTQAVHALVAEIRNERNYLAPIFATIAEMDAYYTLAAKIVATADTENPFCCAEFLDTARPTIHAKKFWNILVNAEITGRVVPNDIFENRNIILTGPNEGGKTTGIRAILQNIVLAQTFGIAAASEFKLTPFDVIHSYLNITDDILHGKSRFASEVRRAQDILYRIKTLQPREKFFFALDELFTGTNAEDGEACAYNFIDNIGSYDNIQFIYATHFNKLKLIGSSNSLCSNYKVDAPIRNFSGRFVYPYTLSQGANDSYVAMDRARDAGLFK